VGPARIIAESFIFRWLRNGPRRFDEVGGYDHRSEEYWE
jgi:hypothetical protein